MAINKWSTVVVISVLVLLMAALSDACSCLQPKHPQEHFCNSAFVIRALVLSRTENMDTYSAAYHVQLLDILKEPENSTIFSNKPTTPSTESNDDISKSTGRKFMNRMSNTDRFTGNYKDSDYKTTVVYDISTDGSNEGSTERSNERLTTERPNERLTTERPNERSTERSPEPTSEVTKATEPLDGVVVLLTSIWGSMCGVSLQEKHVYILGGNIVGDSLTIGLCGLHILDEDDSINKRQRAGFYHKYRDSCDCKIQYCDGPRCPLVTDDDCAVDPSLSFDDFMDCANRYSMCKRRDGKCQWTNNRYHKLCQTKAIRKRFYNH